MAIFTPAYNPTDWKIVFPYDKKIPDRTLADVSLSDRAEIEQHNAEIEKQIAELTKKQQAGAWKNNPDQFGNKVGTAIDVDNIGGETHTFTRVAAFGGGIVPLLNDLSGNTTVATECANLDPATIVPAALTRRNKTGSPSLRSIKYRPTGFFSKSRIMSPLRTTR